ncbi:maltose permease [Dactylonectria estremocensis]|uniref:Maltose permease n=1 Tax=Dactylonectria estremocensis TaxID=1079267 RepID=A0A9P9EXU9_9HYPO|nr:maltose permease [Dactylonectria estremocensis]
MSSADKAAADVPVLRESRVEPDKPQGSAVDIVPLASSTNGPGLVDLWRNKRVLSWCLLIYILPMNFGFEAGSTGNLLAIPSFLSRFGNPLPGGLIEITVHDQQVLNAALICGVFIASACSGFASDLLGRRWTILLGSVVCIVGIFVQGFCQSILMLFGGKLVSAIGFGVAHAIAPVYVAEIAPDMLRGICLILVNAMVVIGSWACSLVAYGTSHIETDWAWRTLLLSQLLFPVIMVVCTLFFLPESPSWLVIHGQTQKAATSLRKINGPYFDTDTAITLLISTIEKEKTVKKEEATFMDCFRGPNRRRTTIVIMTFLAQQFSGSGFIAGYLPYFFTIAGVANPIGIAQISYSIQLLGNIASWFVVDRVGRRPLAVYGLIAMTVTLLIIGGLGTIRNNKTALTATIALMSVWGFLYQFTLGAVAYAVGGETPAPRVRQKTYSINLMCTTASLCLVSQATPLLINPTNANLGAKVAFVFFGLSVPLCIYLYFCFPEMKGRSYLELEEMFQKNVPARQFKNYKCDARIDSTEKGEKAVSVVHDEGSV